MKHFLRTPCLTLLLGFGLFACNPQEGPLPEGHYPARKLDEELIRVIRNTWEHAQNADGSALLPTLVMPNAAMERGGATVVSRLLTMRLQGEPWLKGDIAAITPRSMPRELIDGLLFVYYDDDGQQGRIKEKVLRRPQDVVLVEITVGTRRLHQMWFKDRRWVLMHQPFDLTEQMKKDLMEMVKS